MGAQVVAIDVLGEGGIVGATAKHIYGILVVDADGAALVDGYVGLVGPRATRGHAAGRGGCGRGSATDDRCRWGGGELAANRGEGVDAAIAEGVVGYVGARYAPARLHRADDHLRVGRVLQQVLGLGDHTR